MKRFAHVIYCLLFCFLGACKADSTTHESDEATHVAPTSTFDTAQVASFVKQILYLQDNKVRGAFIGQAIAEMADRTRPQTALQKLSDTPTMLTYKLKLDEQHVLDIVYTSNYGKVGALDLQLKSNDKLFVIALSEQIINDLHQIYPNDLPEDYEKNFVWLTEYLGKSKLTFKQTLTEHISFFQLTIK